MASVNKTLGARFKIEGEEEYKNVIAQLNAGSRTLASEMTRLNAEYKGNTDSVEYLTAKSELLGRQLDQQKQKTEATRKMHEAASEAYAKALERVTEAADQSEEAQAEAREALAAADRELQKYAQQLNLAEASEFNLQHQIDDTNKSLNGQDEELAGLGDTVGNLASKLGIQLPQGATKALNGMKGLSAGTVAAMGAAVAGIAAVIKIVRELGSMTLDVAAQVDEYLAEEQITGVPAEMLQAWDYAAPLIDVDAETIKGSMTKLTKALGDAGSGTESAIAQFAELGVSFRDDVTGELRNSEDVFYDVIDALGNVENQTQRDAIAMELLGKSAQELNPLINQGSNALKDYAAEAKAAGYVLDEYQLAKLGEVDDAYQMLQLTIEGNRKQLAAQFAPAAKEAMELFADVVNKAGKMLTESGIVENLGMVIQNLVEIFKSVGNILANSPALQGAIDKISDALYGLSLLLASVADMAQVIAGLAPWNWGSGMLKTGLGLGYSSGNANQYQRTKMLHEGRLDQYDDFYAGRNATGNDNWRGGLTWVGESGPELVNLPRGSQIYNAQDSAGMANVIIENVVIDAKNVKDFNDIVALFSGYRISKRMGVNALG